MSLIRRHPLASYVALAYGLSWAYWVPMALAGIHTAPGSSTTHLPGLLGPGIAAFIVTGLTDGRQGLVTLSRRLIVVARPAWRFAAYSLSAVAFLALAVAVALVTGASLPPWSDFGVYSGLVPMSVPAVFLVVLFFNGFGEETGWRGYALEPLERRFGPVGGPLVLSMLWAGWHAPTFFVVETYRLMTLPVIIGGFGLGICAGSFVLARVAHRTHGSILAVSLWHAFYNMTSATAASRGVIAAVTTTCVMVWATAIVVEELRRSRAGRAGARAQQPRTRQTASPVTDGW